MQAPPPPPLGQRLLDLPGSVLWCWQAMEGAPLPSLAEGESLQLQEVELHQGKTSAPDYLSESELIGLMEKHGIGTDASISVHINNICERNYVSIQAGRKVVPTELGITLVRGYQLIDPELCRAQVHDLAPSCTMLCWSTGGSLHGLWQSSGIAPGGGGGGGHPGHAGPSAALLIAPSFPGPSLSPRWLYKPYHSHAEQAQPL